ncbi:MULTISPECIES: hypothetical protein [Streptomyces]|uniref:hypothetical protein n=1 Tax=Streptomyces TaxID=1883 RepID=UPI00073DD325|nr:hypothetical protein [Streptomyces sp. FBKL.4005]OYP10265.1 hypothetical protein CFC35_41485 [Streptomyces sp. FBKL.4005]CUW33411.1 hypothetical protein TUE45_pSRTUE45a_0043 [Streptomyces reticuli]
MTGRAVPPGLYAALQACFPHGGLPRWLTTSGPRCGTGAAPVQVDGAGRVEELADLVALALWEFLQEPGGDPFTKLFTAACIRHLS